MLTGDNDFSCHGHACWGVPEEFWELGGIGGITGVVGGYPSHFPKKILYINKKKFF